MCRFSDAELNCVRTKIRRMSACRQLLIGMSMSRYCPPIGTAGLDRWNVSGNRRDPCPPPRMSASTSLFTAIAIRKAYTRPRRGVRNGSATIRGFMRLRLLPREEKFYKDFQALADE